MSILARQLAAPLETAEFDARPWLPDESPLAMPRQAFDADAPAISQVLPTSPAGVARRRFALALGTLFFTVLVAIGPYVLYARRGFEPFEVLGLGVFLLLASPIACWFCSALFGFVALLKGREQDDLSFSPRPVLPGSRTALLMPLCNEDAAAAFGRLAAIDVSLARLGASHAFDFYVLSDSSDRVAPAEEAAFLAFRAHAHSRVYMRRRVRNTERKAGNIADWVSRFGGAYECMIVLDADSVLAGETVLRLVDAMERNPGVGLIQTAPVIVGARTLFARVSQFSVRMYGRVAAAGYGWWTGAESSYWGHNAIVRVEAFAACARLPILPGEKPFGGDVLSHDVVEAALLRRAGWAVHVTAALDGSCEETPPTLLDFIRREHRWCQGNLQHIKLLGASGLHPMSRLQLGMGALAYLASPLWLAALAIGMALQLQHPVDWGSLWYFLAPEFTPFMLGSMLAAFLLIGPKLMGAFIVLSRPGERRAFGGATAVLKSVATEVALSAVLAPVLMVANTNAVIQILRGRDVGWRPQQRDADGISWADAWRAMRPQMIAGVGFTAGLCFRPDLFLCFAPIVLPLLFAAPLAVWTSRRRTGDAFAERGLLLTPAHDGASSLPTVLGGHRNPTAQFPISVRGTAASMAAE
ncbi:glucans biosynthesis glucosyltransferase MdoH [Phenylobacterium sp.]|jgi:membrane glycosyltransferase|uniref:glucans biosynthesis glucosyltransferase MdoH n=1 Tax=Phenylobacterium sp. TaxID=1871053 RepID=UPI002F9479D0